MAHEQDYIALGLYCGVICETLEWRVNQNGLDGTVRDVMNRLTT